MNIIQKIICLFLLLGSIVIISSCGRYSEPVPIEGSGYPHNYPQH